MSPAPVVYVVDDDTDVLGSLRFLLEIDGINVRTFRSGAALLNGSVNGNVDCFVIDYKMPAMSGIDLANRKEKAAAAGIRHVLLKPHLEESLVSRTRGAIREGERAGR